MIKVVIPEIHRAESALNSIDTNILVFYHQGRQGRTGLAGSATSPINTQNKNLATIDRSTNTANNLEMKWVKECVNIKIVYHVGVS